MTDMPQQTDSDLLLGSDQTDSSAATGATIEKETLLDSTETQTAASQEDKTAKAAEQRKKQIAHWVGEIAAGTKSLTDLPADKQWLKPGIEQGLNLLAKEPELDKIVEEKLAQKEAERAFQATLATLKSMSLSKAQIETYNKKFQELKAEKLSDLKAQSLAIQLAGISTDREDQDRLIARQRMALPMQGTNRINDTIITPDDPDFHKKVTNPKEKMKILMQSMRG